MHIEKPSDIKGADSREVLGKVIADGFRFANATASAVLKKWADGEITLGDMMRWTQEWEDLSYDLRDILYRSPFGGERADL